jgi:DNA-binding NarL/FixJ family response regulator
MKVLVADDHWVVRAGLAVLFGEFDEPVTVVEAATPDQVMAALADHADFDMIVIDPLMVGSDPFRALGEVCRAKKRGSVVVFSKSDSRQHLLQSLEAGATGYIPKTASRDDILAALRWVMSGKIWIPPALLDPARSEPAPAPEAEPRPTALVQDQGVLSLTARQKEVLVLLAEGKSNSQIAETLGISEGTVRVHVSAILRVLNVNNRTQAALLAMNRRPG